LEGTEDESGLDDDESNADFSESFAGDEGWGEEGEEGDAGVSESDMFGSDEEGDGFDFGGEEGEEGLYSEGLCSEGGEGEECSELESDGGFDGESSTLGESSAAGYGGGDTEDSVFDEGEDD
jgi:hypothetical protein